MAGQGYPTSASAEGAPTAWQGAMSFIKVLPTALHPFETRNQGINESITIGVGGLRVVSVHAPSRFRARPSTHSCISLGALIKLSNLSHISHLCIRHTRI